MVTLKNNFGVEPDKESVVMNVSEGPNNDSKVSPNGHPKAVLMCRRNSHPFQARTLILNTPAKIGRSVARARPSIHNGIFDCKVLSRNHAIIWYEYETGKFMIQDTKSSNGTFVNNQRLSKGGETSLPREFFSRDVVQFGVDVLENQRKGNEDSENSDEYNHIVTHGCIVATVRLFHPNGKESRPGQPYSAPSPMPPIPQEKICKLELIIHEAQQREERLHDKLEELQLLNSKLETACQEALTNRFEETRLLSKIESLEKQAKVMGKVMSGAAKASEKVEAEIQQLLVDIEKVQSVAREIQEKQHRKLLESEQKLVEAQRVASNLELEVVDLREQASLTESHLQEMGAKCTSYCETIETLKTNLHAQIELTQKLEAQVANLTEMEVERDFNINFSQLNIMDKCKFISQESENEICKRDIENQEVILGWCKKYEESDKLEEKDFINEEGKTEWLTKKLDNVGDAICNGLEHISNCIAQLENYLIDVERCKKNIEKLCSKEKDLVLQLESVKMPVKENEKTENDLDGEKQELVKPLILTALSNEKITELESEKKAQEELLSQERMKQKETEAKCNIIKCELNATIKRCEKLSLESNNLKALLKNHLKVLEESAISHRQKIDKLELERDELINGQEQKLLEILTEKSKSVVETKETQTTAKDVKTSSTNTEAAEKPDKLEVVEAKVEGKSKPLENSEQNRPACALDKPPSAVNIHERKSEENLEGEFERSKESEVSNCSDIGVWDKIHKMQNLFSLQHSNNSNFTAAQVAEMKNLTNSIAEDLVYLLLRERQMSKEKQILEKKLNGSASKNEMSSLGLNKQLLSVVVGICLYFLWQAVVRYLWFLNQKS